MPGVAKCPTGFGAAKCPTGFGWATCPSYRQARICPSVGDLQDVWMTVADAATRPNAFSIGTTCYYFNFSDPTSTTPGTVYTAADATAFDSCAACAGAPCTCPEDVCTNYIVSGTMTRSQWSGVGCTGTQSLLCSGTWNIPCSIAGLGPCAWVFTGGGGGNPCGILQVFGDIGGIVLSLDGSTPCNWTIIVQDTPSLNTWTSKSDVGATPDLGVFPDITGCAYDSIGNIYWQFAYTGITVTCDDAP